MFLSRQAASEAQRRSAGPGRIPSVDDPVSGVMSVALQRMLPCPPGRLTP